MGTCMAVRVGYGLLSTGPDRCSLQVQIRLLRVRGSGIISMGMLGVWVAYYTTTTTTKTWVGLRVEKWDPYEVYGYGCGSKIETQVRVRNYQ